MYPNDSFYDLESWKQSQILASEIYQDLYGDITDGATHYYNPKKVAEPQWASKLTKTVVIGDHHFYK